MAVTDYAYTPDYGCDDQWDTYDPSLQNRATDLAWASMRYLSAGRLGHQPVTLRPCVKRYCENAEWQPHIRDGEWYNGCGHPLTDCSCTRLSEVKMPGEIAEIQNVWVDGALLTEGTDYRTYDSRRTLVRVGDDWPLCQDYSVARDAVGAFAVEYVPGVRPSEAGLWAVGILASEFAKACSGLNCRLPTSVTSLSRQGVSMEFSEGMFAGGNVGIREVDAYVLTLNPNHQIRPSQVWSPDVASGRFG